MQSRFIGYLISGILVALGQYATASAPPNIVMIMVDDLGLYDFSCYGYEAVDTPNTDKLATEGMKFSNAYAGAPVCSPSRAAVISGQSPARLHLTNHISTQNFAPDNPRVFDAPDIKGLPPGTVTFAGKLNEAGYATGFIGKWHLSLTKPNSGMRVVDENTQPDRQGFDSNMGGNGNGGPPSWFSPYQNAYLEDGEEGEYLPYRLADEAEAFMEANQDKPFLLAFWNYTVHSPLETTPELTEKYKAKKAAGEFITHAVYTGMIEATDQVIGRILQKINDLGLHDNTLIILTSDNGGIKGLTYPGKDKLREGKGWLYDGGLRVPLIIRWPGQVQPASTSDERVTHLDFFPTILEAANLSVEPDHPVDGESLIPLLTGTRGLDRDAVYFHYPNYAWHARNRLGSAILEGDYKLLNWHDDNSVELYNVSKDPGENLNLAAKKPELAERLKKKLQEWLTATEANMPIPNDNYVAADAAD